MQQRRPRPRAPAHDERAGDALVADARVAPDRLGDAQPVLERPQDHLAHPPPADEVEVGLGVERADQDGERLDEGVAAEVVEPGPGPGLGEQLVEVEGPGRGLVHRAALAGDRVLHPRGRAPGSQTIRKMIGTGARTGPRRVLRPRGSAMGGTVRLEYRDSIAVITNDNPEKHNAFDDDMDAQLFEILAELQGPARRAGRDLARRGQVVVVGTRRVDDRRRTPAVTTTS